MELYFLDNSFTPVTGPVDRLTYVMWRERYFETGSFVLRFPRELLPELIVAKYVSTSAEEGEIKCGRIEYITDDGKGECEMGGRLLEALLSDRIITGEGVIYGNVTSSVTSAVEYNLRGCGVTVGTGDSISADAFLTYSWSCLSDWLYSVLKPYGASFTVRLDGESDAPVFRVIKGGNRTVDGCEEGLAPAVFSTSFGNIGAISLRTNEGRMKNFAHVQGKDGTVVTVDMSNGGERREMYCSAGDIAAGSFDSAELYKEALAARGREVLARHGAGIEIGAESHIDALPKYGVDYFLGDVCDVADEALGMSFDMRLTGVDTVWENGTRTVYPQFSEERQYLQT